MSEPGITGPDAVRFEYPITPRYLEVDRQGVVFNMWYLGYFDDAFAAFLADGGLAYADLLAQGYDVSLVHSELDWMAGLAFGDQATIVIGVAHVGRTSFTLTFEVQRPADHPQGQTAAIEVLCRCRTVYVVVAVDRSGKRAIPSALLARLGRIATP